MIQQSKKVYTPPLLTRVRLDIANAVLGSCQVSTIGLVAPTCRLPSTACPTRP